jgi:riboflavin kinase, archaea type
VKALPQVVFEGTVFSGEGEGKKFVDLPWVKRQIEAKLGFTPFSGTLNIHLTPESAKQKKLLKTAETQQITPEKGYCKGILIKAKIGHIDGAIVVPQVPSYPNGVLEVISAECLREKLKLQDGNTVTVTVNV